MKISVIMQVYLGEYKYSRSYPKKKFIRAVNSFLNQSYKNKELIIVSDNCPLSRKIYENLYSDIETIRFHYISRGNDEKKMYESTNEDKIYYRCHARQIGLNLVTGDVITYLDSDDIILPHYLETLAVFWKQIVNGKNEQKINFICNNVAILHNNYSVKNPMMFTEEKVDLLDYGITEEFNIYKFANKKCIPFLCTFSHIRDFKFQWEDVENFDLDINFDCNEFLNRAAPILRGYDINIPGYVVCHYRKLWDV